jgi:type III restriction enzyme
VPALRGCPDRRSIRVFHERKFLTLPPSPFKIALRFILRFHPSLRSPPCRANDAILPDENGDAPLLPRLNRYRPVGSTDNVFFKTVKPVQGTEFSHLGGVACDTDSWEQAAMFQIEQAARKGAVRSYVRNERLDFAIPYERYGLPHVYEPDFLVKLADGITLVVEIKGREYEGNEEKKQAVARWMQAVNNWGKLGRWDFVYCRDPQKLCAMLEKRTLP